MGGKSTTTSSADPWGPIQPNLKDIANEGEKLFNKGGFSADPYQGDRVAGFGHLTNRAFDMFRNTAKNGAAGTEAAINSLTDMMRGGGQYDLTAVKNNALGSAIPAATAMFSGSGLADSSMAMDTVGRAALEAVAPYEYDAHNQWQNNVLSAAGMMPGLEQAQYVPAQMLQSVGTMKDMMRQTELDAKMAKYYERQNQPMNNLQGYTNLLNPLATMGGTSQSTTTQSPGVMDILGTGLQLFGLFSDRRTKENIVHIGTHKGRDIYAYNYLWSPTMEAGVMADEAPDMICGEVGGFAVVDYARF